MMPIVYDWDVTIDGMFVAGGHHHTMQDAAQMAFSYAVQYAEEAKGEMKVIIKERIV